MHIKMTHGEANQGTVLTTDKYKLAAVNVGHTNLETAVLGTPNARCNQLGRIGGPPHTSHAIE